MIYDFIAIIKESMAMNLLDVTVMDIYGTMYGIQARMNVYRVGG